MNAPESGHRDTVTYTERVVRRMPGHILEIPVRDWNLLKSRLERAKPRGHLGNNIGWALLGGALGALIDSKWLAAAITGLPGLCLAGYAFVNEKLSGQSFDTVKEDMMHLESRFNMEESLGSSGTPPFHAPPEAAAAISVKPSEIQS